MVHLIPSEAETQQEQTMDFQGQVIMSKLKMVLDIKTHL